MKYPIIVIGAGHAGVEAALAASRLGVHTALITLRKSGVGQMSCNPAIGGLGKGQLVREVDALGGIMGRAIDNTGIQFRLLNSSRGPAVQSSRAQADRDLYKAEILKFVLEAENIDLIEAEVSEILADQNRVQGVKLNDGKIIYADNVVLTTGTFLKGLMHTGKNQTVGGRNGDMASNSLSQSLKNLGFNLGRLKTGTPPRLKKSSIDFSKLEEQPGDENPKPFSLLTDKIHQKQISCWITATNENVHEIIRSNKDNSPMFNGQIKSGGPRYCPSIEDKVFRFQDKSKHNIFLEPEGYNSDIVYPNGISTSLPLSVQEDFVRKINGLENVEILQAGYAVEYDMVDPRSLYPTMETKDFSGLFFAGQINGTSGYEEAAGQGLVAGTNAALQHLNQNEFILSRSEAYIGVMIDDLITKGVDEPYRMFTSRAEYRLLLREDNTCFRLCPKAIEYGLLNQTYLKQFENLNLQYLNSKKILNKSKIQATAENNQKLLKFNSAEIKDTIFVNKLACRPELSLKSIIDNFDLDINLDPFVLATIETELKFEGYIRRQQQEIKTLNKMENRIIPKDFAYDQIPGLRTEVIQRLSKLKPHSLGQAMRIPGITPAAISILAVHLKKDSFSPQSV